MKTTTQPTTANQKLSDEQPSRLQNAIAETRKRYGTAAQFMLTFNKDIQTKAALNPHRAYLGNAPSLSIVRQAYSTEVLTLWIMAQLEDINDFVSIKQKMTVGQLEQTANIIAAEYAYLKASELHLFLHRLKAGHYGTFFGCIDPLQITRSLNQFAEQRRAEITRIEHRQNQLKLEQQRDLWAQTAVTRQQYEQIKKQTKP